MVKALAHLCFTVADLNASEAFYRDRLGFTPAFDFFNESGARYGTYLHIGGRSFVELFQGEPKPTAGSYSHFSLEVDDLPGMVDALRAAGVQVSDPLLGGDNSWQAWLADPDGNRIELHMYTPESQQAPWAK